jgi:protein O-GlcNAc transferase
VYQYLGVAQYALGDLKKATQTFEEAVTVNDDDVDSWVQLGECYLYGLELVKATSAFEVAVLKKGAVTEMHRLFKARNWMADWQERDQLIAQVERNVDEAIRTNKKTTTNALDFAELPAAMVLKLSQQLLANGNTSLRTPLSRGGAQDFTLRSPELRIGFVSSDFGVHPVATLMRGLLSFLATPDHNVKVYCFSLTAATSWWKRNITRSVDVMVSLTGKNPAQAAEIIHSHRINILVDLNGHTLHSGLPIFSYRPAPVQISFLGYPMTTGSDFIDYFVSDRVSTPADTSASSFSERLLLLPSHYIVNDHMQMLSHTLEGDRPRLEDVAPVHKSIRGDNTFVFATFSNWQVWNVRKSCLC